MYPRWRQNDVKLLSIFFQILTGVASFVLWEMEMNNYDGDIEQNNVKRGVDWDGQKSFEY